MTRILVVSDSHGNKHYIKELIESVNFDYMFFLGDVLKDVEELKIENLIKVRGNWDTNFNVKTIEFITIDGIKFMLLHGHGYGVKTGLGYLIKEAEKENANFVCYGHTHVSDLTFVNGVGYLNPGSLSTFKGGQKTYAVINIDNGKIKAEILDYDNLL